MNNSRTPLEQNQQTLSPLFCTHCGAMRFVLPDACEEICWRCRMPLIHQEHPRDSTQAKE